MDLDELYDGLLTATAANKRGEYLRQLGGGRAGSGLDCLLHPEKYAPVWKNGRCDCMHEGDASCTARCIFSAIGRDDRGQLVIDKDRCVGCGACIEACKNGHLTESRDVLPVLDALKSARGPVYAMVAPAFIGQYGTATPGQLRSAFKALGFAGMVEVALFADILTLKEALIFDRNIKSREDFMLTSCCCPVWIAMVRRGYTEYLEKLPDSVSPMAACGRAVKKLEPTAVTVFIGPCLAKKAEARERELAGAVDFVLTFQEVRDIFAAFQLEPSGLPEDGKEHSSKAGRLYGRTGGVSEAVKNTVMRLNPGRTLSVQAEQADGPAACRALLERLRQGRVDANYLEGMGCEGGCVGGPKVLTETAAGQENLSRYGEAAASKTPLDNPYVLQLLEKLGIATIDSLIDAELFTRCLEAAAAR